MRWIKADGEGIPVGLMTPAHAKNSLRLVLANYPNISHRLRTRDGLKELGRLYW